MDQPGGCHPNPLGRFADDSLDHRVPTVDRGTQRPAADRRHLGADVFGQVWCVTTVGGLGRGGGNRQAAGDVFEGMAAVVAPGRSTGIDGEVPDLHTGDPVSPQDASFVDATSPDSGSGKDAHHAATASRRAEAVLAVHARVDVVDHQHRAVHLLGQPVADRHVAPTQVDGLVDHPAGHVDRAGTTDADTTDRRAVQAGLGQRLVDRFDDSLEVLLGRDRVERRLAIVTDHLERRIVDAGQHLRAAQVKSYPHSLVSQRHSRFRMTKSGCPRISISGAKRRREMDVVINREEWRGSTNEKKAERAGFEPAVPVSRDTAFPVPHNRPLCHLSES